MEVELTQSETQSGLASTGSYTCYGGDFGKIGVGTYVQNLSDDDKYNLITNPFVPSSTYKFPSRKDIYGKNRHFQLSWLTKFPGLVYSPSLNGGLCKYCVMFGKVPSGSAALGVLVS